MTTPPRELTIRLDPPVSVNGQTYAEIHLREPTVQECLDVSTIQGLNATIDLVAKVAGVPRDAVLQMGISRLRTADEYLNLFTTPGKLTRAADRLRAEPPTRTVWWAATILEMIVSDLTDRWYWPPSVWADMRVSDVYRWLRRLHIAKRRRDGG